MIIDSTFEILRNPSLQHYDDVINDSKDGSLILEDDPGRRPREIEFTVVQTFSDREHFHDMLNEFAIMKTLSLNVLNQKIEGLL